MIAKTQAQLPLQLAIAAAPRQSKLALTPRAATPKCCPGVPISAAEAAAIARLDAALRASSVAKEEWFFAYDNYKYSIPARAHIAAFFAALATIVTPLLLALGACVLVELATGGVGLAIVAYAFAVSNVIASFVAIGKVAKSAYKKVIARISERDPRCIAAKAKSDAAWEIFTKASKEVNDAQRALEALQGAGCGQQQRQLLTEEPKPTSSLPRPPMPAHRVRG